MKKIRMLNRMGIWETREWSYDPKENTDARERAYEILKGLNIEDAIVTEVAPEVFWYSTPSKKINCKSWEDEQEVQNDQL